MYKNQRRKSDRLTPYNIASSSSFIRKSNQFVSPVVNRELTYSAKYKENRSSNLLNTTISDFNNESNLNKNLNKDLNKTAINQQVINDNKIINNQLQLNNKTINEFNQQSINKINQQSINKSNQQSINNSNQQLINNSNQQSINNSNQQLINKESNEKLNEKSIDKEINQLINKTNNESKLDEMIFDVKSNKQNSNQKIIKHNEDDFNSDSEFDKIFEASSLSDKLNKQFPNHTIDSNEITNDDLEYRIQSCNDYENDGDELFDSDAVFTQASDNESMINNDDEQSIDNGKIDDEFDKNLNDNLNDNFDDEFDDDLGDELDCTLIYNGNKEDDEPIIKSQAVPIDKLDCDFKTAAGKEIKISKEKIEAMKQKAKSLGLLPDFTIEANISIGSNISTNEI